jgi:hypothetical protein
MAFTLMDGLNRLKTLLAPQNPSWFLRGIAHINPDHHISLPFFNQPKRFAFSADLFAKTLELFAHLMVFRVRGILEVLEGVAQELLLPLQGRRDEAVGCKS